MPNSLIEMKKIKRSWNTNTYKIFFVFSHNISLCFANRCIGSLSKWFLSLNLKIIIRYSAYNLFVSVNFYSLDSPNIRKLNLS